jgi:tetratricopeptide (TPR) repeat protein
MRMRVSLCLITKNEALTLPGCLNSVAGLADEIIVVDTGSLDNTREVARELGARVHDFVWVDDFAAARNECNRHATGDWILWLDGDEYFDADNRDQLRALLEGLNDENVAYLMRQRSRVSSAEGDAVMLQCRLFRNLPAIRWEYRVHEQIQPAVERCRGTVRPTEIFIDHSGYEDAAVYLRKLKRNLRLLLLEDQERPNDPFTLMNLGWAYKNLGQIAAAVAYYRRGLERSRPGTFVARKLYRLLVRAHHALRQQQLALDACRDGLAAFPDDVEISFLHGVLLSETGRLAAAEAAFLRLAEAPPGDRLEIDIHPGIRGDMVRHNLARVYKAQGRTDDAEAQYRAALAHRPDSVRSLYELGLLLLEKGRAVETEPIVRKLDALGPIGTMAATMLLAQRHLRQGEVAQARGLLETAVAAEPPALEPRVMLSRLLVESGADGEPTERALRAVLALAPDHDWARAKLASVLNKQQPQPAPYPAPQPQDSGPSQPYSRELLTHNHVGAYRSAKEVVPHVLELLRPKSVVDVGCGVGSWLAVFQEHGIDDFLGVDGAYVDLDLLQIPQDKFRPHDLTQLLQLDRQFDLAVSLEVAEHLPAEYAASFVASLVGLARVVLFSAAVPYQGGHHHVNEQWPGYWVNLFEQHGYLVLDCLRGKVWLNDRVDWWYRQNLLLFCSPEVLVKNARLQSELQSAPDARLPVVHPGLFLQAIDAILDLRRQLAILGAQPSSTESRR